MKVYLQYPYNFPDSSYYKSLTLYKPKGVEFVNDVNQFKVNEDIKLVKKSNRFKQLIRGVSRKLDLPLVNAHLSPKGNYDLIHCCHCLSLNTDKNWVCDIESDWQLFVSGEANLLSKRFAKSILERNNCKKVFCWTEETKNRISNLFKSSVIDSKLMVLSFALPVNRKKKWGKRFVLLFVARYFLDKGGDVALEVIDKVVKQNRGVEGLVVSDTPKEFVDKYSGNKKIRFVGLMAQKDLFGKVYPNCSVFVYPGFSDSFGFGFVECMSFGVPVVTVDGYARREIVVDGFNGFVVRKSKSRKVMVRDMVRDVECLVSDRLLWESFSSNCWGSVAFGKWSLGLRNELLLSVYRGALF